MKITGIILAGGKSSRMEQDKGLMPLDKKPMIQWVIEAIKPLVDEIIIISNQEEYNQFGYPVYEDLIKDSGPLAGIYTGLTHSSTKKNVVVSCDTPFLSSELIKKLIKQSVNYEVVIPQNRNKKHPLIGVYSRSCISVFKTQLEEGERKLMDAINKVNLSVLDANSFDEKVFSNINTQEEFKKIDK